MKMCLVGILLLCSDGVLVYDMPANIQPSSAHIYPPPRCTFFCLVRSLGRSCAHIDAVSVGRDQEACFVCEW